jgi:hypothetical protein
LDLLIDYLQVIDELAKDDWLGARPIELDQKKSAARRRMA